MPAKKYYVGVERKDFTCEICGRVVTVQEQRELNYHQTRFCREHQIEHRKAIVRQSVKKYYDKKKQVE